MKSFSDELPNVDKTTMDNLAAGVVDANKKINTMCYDQSRTHDLVVWGLVLGVINFAILVATLYFTFHH